MNQNERIHWEVLAVRLDNGVYPVGPQKAYWVELRGLFFPSEVITKVIRVRAERPKKIRNWFYHKRSTNEVESLQTIGGGS